jgi:hypothetical protein
VINSKALQDNELQFSKKFQGKRQCEKTNQVEYLPLLTTGNGH